MRLSNVDSLRRGRSNDFGARALSLRLISRGPSIHNARKDSSRSSVRSASSAAHSVHQAHPRKGLWDGLLSREHDKEIISVSTPALAAMLLEPIMATISAMLVGQLGTGQLSAVSVGSLAVSFFTFLFSFLLFLTTPEVAGAVAKKDLGLASKVASKSLWLAGGFSLLTAAFCSIGSDLIVSVLKPPEPAVAEFASQYIKVRSLGIMPSLISYVAVAVFRGFKDTKTSLFAAILSAVSGLLMNLLFLNVLHLGVTGAALAAVLSSCVSCVTLWTLLIQKEIVRVEDIMVPPSKEAVLPLLRAGAPLAVRNLISFGMVIYASLLCVRAGSAYQASFEIIRLVWVLTIQFFECLNVATQALCASYLGSGDWENARAVMLRLTALGGIIGLGASLVVFISQHQLVSLFTKDTAVIHQVLMTLPMIAFFFPLDAVASIMDGSLMAAKQTDYLAAIQILGAGVQYLALIYLSSNSLVSTLSIWSCLKILTMVRLVGGGVRNLASNDSAYWKPPALAASTSSEQATTNSSNEHSASGEISRHNHSEEAKTDSYGPEATELDGLQNQDPGTCTSLHKINASLEAECVLEEATGSVKTAKTL